MTYQERKQARKEHYLTYVYGWELRPCPACSGSGVYDNTGSPPCGACGGTGKERYPDPKALTLRAKQNNEDRRKTI